MPPRKKQSVAKVNTSESSLAFSELHIRLEALEEEHKSILKKIKKKQTEIKNFVEQMRSVASQMFEKVSPIMQNMAEIDEEIHQLFAEIFTTRKLGLNSRITIEEIYVNLQDMGFISSKIDNIDEDTELDEMFENFPNETEFANQNQQKYTSQNQPHETASAEKSETSRKIRKTFLKLAEIFHPDKVTDNETQMRHNEIMKEINKAYQEGDIAKLLEIEKQYKLGEEIDINDQSDDLTRKCDRLQEKNNILQDQYENLKRELRQVKNTPEGAIVADYRKAVKQGNDFFAEMIQQVEFQKKCVEEVRDFVKDFRNKKITIKKFVKGPEFLNLKQKIMEDMMAEMMQEIDWD